MISGCSAMFEFEVRVVCHFDGYVVHHNAMDSSWRSNAMSRSTLVKYLAVFAAEMAIAGTSAANITMDDVREKVRLMMLDDTASLDDKEEVMHE